MSPRKFSGALQALIVLTGMWLMGSTWAGGMHVHDAWSRPTPPGIEVGVAYFTITNGGQTDRLLGAASPVAARTELHISRMEGGVMTMEHLDAVEVKRGEPVSFSPNGRHVMLLGLKQPLKAGDSFPLTLSFEKAGAVKLEVHVQDMAPTGEGRGMDHPRMDHSKMHH